MVSETLIDDLIQLLGQPHNIDAGFADWRERGAEHLRTLAPSERQAWLDRVQQILAENRTLFQQERQHLINELVHTPPSPRKEAQAKHYRSVRDL